MILDDPRYTIPVTRASGPLTPSSSGSGIHRVYVTCDGQPKRITRPVTGPLPELECASDPLIGQSRAQHPTTIIRAGADAPREARARLSTDGKLHMTTTVIVAGRAVRVTIAGRVLIAPNGKPLDRCYFQAGDDFRQGNFDGLWGMVTRAWPDLRDATWAFAPFAQLDPDCWARVEAAWRQYGKRGA